MFKTLLRVHIDIYFYHVTKKNFMLSNVEGEEENRVFSQLKKSKTFYQCQLNRNLKKPANATTLDTTRSGYGKVAFDFEYVLTVDFFCNFYQISGNFKHLLG